MPYSYLVEQFALLIIRGAHFDFEEQNYNNSRSVRKIFNFFPRINRVNMIFSLYFQQRFMQEIAHAHLYVCPILTIGRRNCTILAALSPTRHNYANYISILIAELRGLKN